MRTVSPPGINEGAAVMSQIYNICRFAHAIMAEKSRRMPR